MPDGSNTDNPFLRGALNAQARGLYVAPGLPGFKKPAGRLVEHGVHDASNDPEQIKKWWDAEPTANVLVTSPDGRYVIIDLDVTGGKQGPTLFGSITGKSIVEWAWETLVVETRSGGHQIFFEANECFSNGVEIAPGIDVRSAGGYGIFPPSFVAADDKHPVDGSYSFFGDNAIAPLPPIVRELLRRPMQRQERRADDEDDADLPESIERARAYLEKRAPAIEGSGGNNHTYVTFCQLRDFGLSLDKAMELAMIEDGWNSRCEPPWTESELLSEDPPYGPARNAYVYAKKSFGDKQSTGLMTTLPPPPPPDAADIPTTADLLKADAAQRAAEEWSDPFLAWRATHPAHPNVAPVVQALRSPGFQTMAELEDEAGLVEPEWMVAETVLSLANNSLSGPPGGGKTILLLMVAVAVASGKPLFGIRVARQSPVVLVLAEDNRAVVRDILRTICKSQDLDLRKLPIHLECMPDDPLSFLVDPSVKTQWVSGPYFNRLMAKLDAVGPCLLVLDTDLDVADFDENKRPEVRTFCKRFLAGFTRHAGATPLVTSHVSVAGTRDGRGYSGSTTRAGSFRNMVALEFEDGLEKEEMDTTNKRILRNVKRNRGAKAAPLTLHFDHNGLLSVQPSAVEGSRTAEIMRAVVREVERLREASVLVRTDNLGRSGAVGLKGLVLALRKSDEKLKAKADEIAAAIMDLQKAGKLMMRSASAKAGKNYRPATLLVEPWDKAEMDAIRAERAAEIKALARDPETNDPAHTAKLWAAAAIEVLMNSSPAFSHWGQTFAEEIARKHYVTARAANPDVADTDPTPIRHWLDGAPVTLRRFLAHTSTDGAPIYVRDPDAYRAALAKSLGS